MKNISLNEFPHPDFFKKKVLKSFTIAKESAMFEKCMKAVFIS